MSTPFDQKTTRFVSWIQSNFDFVSPKFEVADLRSQSQGRGLIAKEDISVGETLFEFPRDKIINFDSSTLSQLNDGKNRDILIELGQWDALILCVAYELILGKESRWWDYLNILPQSVEDFNTLMFWNDDELEKLKPSSVLDRIGKEDAEMTYSRLVPEYCNRLGVPKLADFLTLDKFHAVASLIMSYSFDVDHVDEVDAAERDQAADSSEAGIDEIEQQQGQQGEEDQKSEEDDDDDDDDDDTRSGDASSALKFDSYLKSMVPLADTLNANTTLVNATLHYDHDKLAMKAIKPINKGDQIFNTYGDLPNSEIMRKYGYVELPSSAAEFADIPLTVITQYYQKKFSETFSTVKNVDHIVERLLDLIGQSEYLEETLEDNEGGIVIERYEIYSGGELLPEFILLLLILSTLYESFKTDLKWFRKLARQVDRPESDFEIFVNRATVKCFQLLDQRSIVTEAMMEDLKQITSSRIDEYPRYLINGEYKLPAEFKLDMTRKGLADIILKNEVMCLQDILDGKFPPVAVDSGEPKFEVMSNEKFLKNVMKRKQEEDEKRSRKRHRVN
ncbi:DEKNAAC105451 [Brettanomyces naardenensis]|uniref:DEKNAAC105451 n=1 Tax=Brettanomyces naardenensis TaxID=13370 RepID=A0A448YTH1_BRENA|nr:DEKNAAC105451 [Brettanomyces naardenensis]